jgi:hypothetical protein
MMHLRSTNGVSPSPLSAEAPVSYQRTRSIPIVSQARESLASRPGDVPEGVSVSPTRRPYFGLRVWSASRAIAHHGARRLTAFRHWVMESIQGNENRSVPFPRPRVSKNENRLVPFGKDIRMAYHFAVEKRATYLHITGAGALTEQNLRRFLLEAYQASVKQKCDSLLLEMSFSGPPLNLHSIYSVIADRSPDGARLRRIAYVDTNTPHAIDPAEFAELTAKNRGVNVRLFRNLPGAERWLQERGNKQ